MLTVAKTCTSLPLVLSIITGGTGLQGLAPMLRLRDASTLTRYLDFSTGTFKTTGWTVREILMPEVGSGHYQYTLNVAWTPGILAGMYLAAEYTVIDGAGTRGDEIEVVHVVDFLDDVALLRKNMTNRCEMTTGAPGRIRLYDDDNSTPLISWEVRDETGGGVVVPAASPALRGQGTRHSN